MDSLLKNSSWLYTKCTLINDAVYEIFLTFGKVSVYKWFFCLYTGSQLEEEGEVCPALLQKSKKLPWFWKKGPDYVHLWVMPIFGFCPSLEKTPNFFLAGPFFLVLLMKCLSKCTSYTKTALPWKICGCAPGTFGFRCWK